MHPGYTPPRELLNFPRADQTTDETFGVHFGTALVACQIVANNAFDNGYLSVDVDGYEEVDEPFDFILTKPVYYFFVCGHGGRTRFISRSPFIANNL